MSEIFDDWAAVGFTDTEFRCDDETAGGAWQREELSAAITGFVVIKADAEIDLLRLIVRLECLEQRINKIARVRRNVLKHE